jgi:hypothetical protein
MRMARLLTAIGCCFLCFDSFTFGEEASQAGADPQVCEAVRKGVDFLVRTQHTDGSWGESTVGRSYEVIADVPGSHRAFRVATSALCVMALKNCGIREEAVENAVRRGLKYLVKQGRVKRPNPLEMYSVWAFGYGLRCLSEAIFAGTCPDMEASMRERAEELVAALKLYQVPDGGWGYYDFVAGTYRPSGSSMSFMTGTVLISLYAAKRAGIDAPEKTVQKALLSLHRARKQDGSYLYGWYLRYSTNHPVNKLKGSVCRTSCCHLAQYLFNKRVSYEDLVKGVEALVEHNRFVDIARKRPVPHEAWYSTSGYFYLYGHFYASMVLQQLSPKDQKRLWPNLKNLILRLQEPDGSWSDYPLYGYHKYYGTAYAVLTLCWDRGGRELYVKSSAQEK